MTQEAAQDCCASVGEDPANAKALVRWVLHNSCLYSINIESSIIVSRSHQQRPHTPVLMPLSSDRSKTAVCAHTSAPWSFLLYAVYLFARCRTCVPPPPPARTLLSSAGTFVGGHQKTLRCAVGIARSWRDIEGKSMCNI